MPHRRPLIAGLACLAVAALSLLVANEPVYDAWSWLVWGRELADLRFDATTGPTWKPLPVVIAVPLSLAGGAAPDLWLVLVRAAWLLALVLGADIALTLTGGASRARRAIAAAFAVAVIVLLTDDVTQWSRQVAGGMAEPLLVAVVLGAVRAALAQRTRSALALGALAALLRPEAFALLALYALWCWRSDRRARPVAIGVALAVPLLWIAPQLPAGTGSAARAQTDTSNPWEALGWAFALPLAVAWPLAIVALHDRRARLLGAGAIAWIAIVAAMTLAGFPGLPRFMAPAAAITGVLGAAGLVALLERPPSGRRSAAVALVVVALTLTAIGLPDRVAELPRAWNSAARISDSHDRLRGLVDRVGPRRLFACGRLATSDVLVRTLLAWELHVPLSRVVSFGTRPRLSGAFVVGLQASPGLRQDVREAAQLVAADGEWSVYSIDCPATARPSPPARSAGVSGATR